MSTTNTPSELGKWHQFYLAIRRKATKTRKTVIKLVRIAIITATVALPVYYCLQYKPTISSKNENSLGCIGINERGATQLAAPKWS